MVIVAFGFIQILNNGCISSHACHSLIAEIHVVKRGACAISWNHVHREANQVANLLVKQALSLDVNIRMFEVVPDFVSNALLADASCTWFPRGF